MDETKTGKDLLKGLKDNYGLCQVDIERAFELKMHELDNTEKPETVALLKILRSYMRELVREYDSNK